LNCAVENTVDGFSTDCQEFSHFFILAAIPRIRDTSLSTSGITNGAHNQVFEQGYLEVIVVERNGTTGC